MNSSPTSRDTSNTTPARRQIIPSPSGLIYSTQFSQLHSKQIGVASSLEWRTESVTDSVDPQAWQ